MLGFLLWGGIAHAAGPTATVSLSPSSIPADGMSQSVVTVTLSPPLTGQSITLSAPFDPHISFSAVQDNGDGTYTATLTSSRSAETTQIFAFDASGTTAAYPAVLTQLGASATSVVAVATQPVSAANPPVSNQGVVLVATVSSLAGNLVPPNGTVSFENAGTPIAGCQSVPIPLQQDSSASVTCGTSFNAGASPASVTAVFSPATGSLVAGSTSAADIFPIERDATSTSVSINSEAAVGAPVTFLAGVMPGHGGMVAPTGFVRFSDNGGTIQSCRQQPVNASGTANCTITYRTSGPHMITASYIGDEAFNGSTSGPLPVSVQPLGAIAATMQWKFFSTPRYTRVLQLIVNRVPVGSTISISCHGRGCQVRKRLVVVRMGKRCGATKRRRCAASRTVNLASWIAKSRLRPRTQLKIAINKAGWIGKAYIFTVHAGRAPTVQIGCVEPGSRIITTRC